MSVDVIMPQMGESIFEGTITRWLKKPGDRVERDEPLFEISTDKVDAEIPAPSAGVLQEIKVKEGQTVPIQTVVAVIDAAGAILRGAFRACCATGRGSRRPPSPAPAAPAPTHRVRKPRPGCAATSRKRCRPRPPSEPTARRFAAPRWSASWPRNTTWTLRPWRAAAPAGASARKIFSRR